MACNCNAPCDGNDPYKPGGSQSSGSAYCSNCHSPYYGPGFPIAGNGPTAGGCLPDDSDPCAKTELQATSCPNGICDDRLADTPPSKRIGLIGIVGRCIYRFASKSIGFIVSDETGQYVTNRPCIKIPFLKSYLTSPSTGEVLQDVNGDALEGPVPEFDSLLVADPCGCQNRVQGTSGKMQTPLWNGVSYEFVDYEKRDNNPLLNPEDVPIVDSNACPLPLVATLVPTSKSVTGDCGDDELVRGYIIGGMRNFGDPAGTIHIWGGRDDAVPAGYTLADGRQLDAEDWPDVFAAIGYAWGGNGGNLFNLPDLRGTFLRGVDLGTGNDPDAATRTAIATGGNTGDSVGSVQEDQMQCFSAAYDKYVHISESVVQSTAGPSKQVAQNSDQYEETPIELMDDGCGDPRFGNETRPKNAYVNYIIRTGCPPEVA